MFVATFAMEYIAMPYHPGAIDLLGALEVFACAVCGERSIVTILSCV